MKPTGAQRTSRSRRVMLAAAAFGATAVAALSAVGPTETMAAVTGNLWAGSNQGLRAAGFQIESSLTPNGPWTDHTLHGPLALAGSTNPGTIAFTTPIVVAPGQTTYARVYLRTSVDSEQSASVSVTAAQKLDDVPGSGVTSDDALWNSHITYAARATSDDNPFSPKSCNATRFTSLSDPRLFGKGILGSDTNVPLTSTPSGQTFTLAPRGESIYMVCYRFHLSSDVTMQSPTSNGKSVHPYWVFTGVAQ